MSNMEYQAPASARNLPALRAADGEPAAAGGGLSAAREKIVGRCCHVHVPSACRAHARGMAWSDPAREDGEEKVRSPLAVLAVVLAVPLAVGSVVALCVSLAKGWEWDRSRIALCAYVGALAFMGLGYALGREVSKKERR